MVKTVSYGWVINVSTTHLQTIWNDIWSYTQCHLHQAEELIFCVRLATHACNVWHNMLSRGCQHIGHHFKPSVHTLNTYRQNLKWRPMPDKMAEKLVMSNIASVRNQWNSKDSVFLLAQMTYVLTNVNSHIFGGHRTSFQAFSPYINYQSLILQIPTMFVSCL